MKYKLTIRKEEEGESEPSVLVGAECHWSEFFRNFSQPSLEFTESGNTENTQ